MSKRLTDRQQEILDFIETYINSNNRPPTILEIKDTFEFKSPQSVVDHLSALQKKGYIKRIPNSRGIVPLKDKNYLSMMKNHSYNKKGKNYFPILGKVAAGNPLETEECFDGNFLLEDYYEPDQTFVLKVKGESMRDIGIRDGDMVLVKTKNVVESGEIGVFVINGQYTVKRLVKENNMILLKPENPYFDTISVTEDTEDFRIIGKVVGVHRVIK